MSLLVLKFGGTSVADTEKIKKVSSIIKNLYSQGHEIVVVVSAMAGETNKLLNYAMELSNLSDNDKREELDSVLSSGENVTSSLLALALLENGIKSISLQSWQVKIKTSNVAGNALIEEIDTDLINKYISEKFITIIPGFQGINNEGRITTLGRGGSDTTAAGLAAALKADYCDIYTDVEGIYSADPRLIHDAKIINQVSYEEALELAGSGAKILHPRSIEICMRYQIPLRVFSSITNYCGTIIMPNINETNKITGISYIRNLLLVRLISKEHKILEIMELINKHELHILQIINFSESKLEFVIKLEEKPKLKLIESEFGNRLLRKLATAPGFEGGSERRSGMYARVHEDSSTEPTYKSLAEVEFPEKSNIDIMENISSVSIIGAAISHDKDILYKSYYLLEKENINILCMNNSEIKLSFYLADKDVEHAAKILHSKLIK